MEIVHVPGDQPSEAMSGDTSPPTPFEGMDLSPEARLERIQAINGRLAAGETVALEEVHPLTHSPELVTLVRQRLRHGLRAEV